MATTTAPTIDRRAAIIDAAARTFAAHGFDAGTIRQIAREAGVAEGLIYHYFDGKEALLDAVIRDRSVLSWLTQPGSLPEDAPVEAALTSLVDEALRRMAENADIIAIVWSQIATNTKLAQLLGGVLREMAERVAGYLDRKIAKGELRPCDTEVAARMLAGALVTFTIQQHRLSPPLKYLSPDQFAASLVDTLMRGMALDGASVEEEVRRIDVE